MFVQQFFPSNIGETSAHVTDPLLGETTGDRWIPLIKGQWRGTSFHISWRLHALFIFVAKWFRKDLILQPMKDHGRKTHNDYVTKLIRSADKYPGNPFVTLRAHPSHPAGGTQLFCTYGVIALRKRPRREQRKQRVADLLTSIEHCLFNGSNVMSILCDITHTPLWYSLNRVVAVNNMGWSTKVRGCIYAPVNCFIIGSSMEVMAWCPFGFERNHYPKPQRFIREE